MLLFCVLLSAVVTPPGQAAAMDAFAEGNLYLICTGCDYEDDYRDQATGLLVQSVGVSTEERELFVSDWNSYMMNLWQYLGSGGTCFVVKGQDESLEYGDSVLVYTDRWGSVPIEIQPEELASLAALAKYSLRDSIEAIAHLEMYTLLWDDTLKTEIPLHSPVLDAWFERGRREIQRNQMTD